MNNFHLIINFRIFTTNFYVTPIFHKKKTFFCLRRNFVNLFKSLKAIFSQTPEKIFPHSGNINRRSPIKENKQKTFMKQTFCLRVPAPCAHCFRFSFILYGNWKCPLLCRLQKGRVVEKTYTQTKESYTNPFVFSSVDIKRWPSGKGWFYFRTSEGVVRAKWLFSTPLQVI